MKLIFARSCLPGSFIIRWLTFSKWSHVAAVLSDGMVIEATWPKVRLTTTARVFKTHSYHEWRELDMPEGAEEWLRAQLDKPYDVAGLFMLLNPWRKWEEDDKWFCSELVAKACGAFEDAVRVTPQMLYLLSKPTKLLPQ